MARDPATDQVAQSVLRLLAEKGIGRADVRRAIPGEGSAINDFLDESRTRSIIAATLARIAGALQVPLYELFFPPEKREHLADLLHIGGKLEPDELGRLVVIARALAGFRG
jgi:hypothetical protein